MKRDGHMMDFDIVLEPDPDGGFAVAVPALPGCFSQGRTKQEAITNIREAIQGYLDVFGMPDPPVQTARIRVP